MKLIHFDLNETYTFCDERLGDRWRITGRELVDWIRDNFANEYVYGCDDDEDGVLFREMTDEDMIEYVERDEYEIEEDMPILEVVDHLISVGGRRFELVLIELFGCAQKHAIDSDVFFDALYAHEAIDDTSEEDKNGAMKMFCDHIENYGVGVVFKCDVRSDDVSEDFDSCYDEGNFDCVLLEHTRARIPAGFVFFDEYDAEKRDGKWICRSGTAKIWLPKLEKE